MSRYIIKIMYLEKPKQPIIWKEVLGYQKTGLIHEDSTLLQYMSAELRCFNKSRKHYMQPILLKQVMKVHEHIYTSRKGIPRREHNQNFYFLLEVQVH